MDIIATASKIEGLSKSLVARIAAFEEEVASKGKEAIARAEKYGKLDDAQSPEARNVVSRAVRDAARREASDIRRRLALGTEGERTKRLGEIHAIAERAAELAPLYESPIQMLARMGLGSPERSHYTEQLRTAGPREVENYARWAIHKGDRILAAAVASRLDMISAKQRPLRAANFANEVLGEEFREIDRAFKRIRVAAQHAINVNREFETGRSNSRAKIELGLARRALA